MQRRARDSAATWGSHIRRSQSSECLGRRFDRVIGVGAVGVERSRNGFDLGFGFGIAEIPPAFIREVRSYYNGLPQVRENEHHH